MKLPLFLLKRNKHNSPLIIRRIAGTSMLPEFRPGQLVIGIGWFRRLKPGDVVVFMHEGREKIKRVASVDNGQLTLLGDNPASSTDSRHFGQISSKTVIARIVERH